MADAAPQLKLLVCGKYGVGKSSLCNSLLGRDICEVSDPGESADGVGLDACTKTTTKLTVRLGGVVIDIFDSPGLQDGEIEDEKKYVEDMYSKCKDVDLVLYCTEMTQSRFKPAETRAIGLINQAFGPTIWKRCVFVLTKANLVQASKKKRNAVIEYHNNVFKSFQAKLRSVLKDAGVPESVCDGLRVVAAGYFDPDLETNDSVSGRKIVFASEQCKADPGPPIVLVDFIPELWVTCLETMPEVSRIPYLQATALGGRIMEPTAELNMVLKAAANGIAEKIHGCEAVDHDINPPAPFKLNSSQNKRTRIALTLAGLLGAVAAGGACAAVGGVVGAEVGLVAGAVLGPVGGIAGGIVGGAAGFGVGFLIKKTLDKSKKPKENH